MKTRIVGLSGNIKNAGTVRFETPCVYLGGPHATGKTAFIDLINFVFNKSHPELGSQPADLLLLSPTHEAPLTGQVFLTTGSIKMEIESGNTSSAKKPVATYDNVPSELTSSLDKALQHELLTTLH